MFSTGFTSFRVLFLFSLAVTFFVCVHGFWYYFFKHREFLSINPSASVFVFGGLNVNHEDWLTYSGGTDRHGELCYNFSISNDFTYMLNFPTEIPENDSEIVLSVNPSICSTVHFPQLGNSDPAVVLVSTDLPSSSKGEETPLFNGQLMHFFLLIGTIFGINWRIFLKRISLVLLPLVLSFISGFRLKVMYICLTANIRSCLIYLHDFKLLVLLP